MRSARGNDSAPLAHDVQMAALEWPESLLLAPGPADPHRYRRRRSQPDVESLVAGGTVRRSGLDLSHQSDAVAAADQLDPCTDAAAVGGVAHQA